MIISWILNFVVAFFSLVFFLIPVVSLPAPILSIFSTAVSYWNMFLETFPYASIVWTMFLTVIIPFELGMLIFRFFLGSRLPANAKS